MRKLAIGMLFFAVTGIVTAATTVPHTFTSGTAAKASEVNDNFAALATAIDALGARVDKLEGTLTMSAVAGTYHLSLFSVSPYANSTSSTIYGSNYNLIRTGNDTITLNADGTGTASGSVDIVNYEQAPTAQVTHTNSPDSSTFTWTLSGGAITFRGKTFQHAAGGRLFINVSNSIGDSSVPEIENQIFFLVRG